MCSEYEIISKLKKQNEAIGFTVRFPIRELEDADFHVKIYGSAPIIVVGNDGKPEVRLAKFSLKPPGTKYSTFNARLADWDERRNVVTRISDKWTWKKPFNERRCLVPMSSFFEPIYMGEHAGKVMTFKPAADELLLAAGVWEESPDPKKPGEIYTGFSVIVHTAMPFVLETGHHRSPVFLKPKAAYSYLLDEMTDDDRYDMLVKERFTPQLSTEPQRQLAKGWEKRVQINVEAHEEEMDFVKKFERHG